MSKRALVVLLCLMPLPLPASALTQPGGAAIPAPMGCASGRPTGLAAAFACVCKDPGVCNIGPPCSGPGNCPSAMQSMCETTLAHAFNDNTCIPSMMTGLNPYQSASLVPETFRPSCPLTFTVVTRGTALFRDVFGWYNVTGAKPSPSDLHPMLDCSAGPGAQAVLDIAGDPAYRGGEIGFFLLTPESRTQRGSCAGGDCCASVARLGAGHGYLYFSERRFNEDSGASAAPFIHLLTFSSTLEARKFYFAWEDIYGGSNNDFTDLVTGVSGIECSGGGEACDTGRPGACSTGVTRCEAGALACVGVGQASPETCNGVDDDCDGASDDQATCPRAHEVCHQGRCVPHCEEAQEFACAPGLSCDPSSGFCVDAACVGVTCPTGVCRAGTCGEPCAGIVCPHAQVCRGDACIDPCAGIACSAGEVCARGLCIDGCHSSGANMCGGLLCSADESCTTDGHCVDSACVGITCPAGAYCAAGMCKDACEGVVCPRNAACRAGSCTSAATGDPNRTNDGGGNDHLVPEDDAHSPGCGACAGSRSKSAAGSWMTPLALALALAFRRRR